MRIGTTVRGIGQAKAMEGIVLKLLLHRFPRTALSSGSAIRNGQNVTLNIDCWSYAVAAIPAATLGDGP